MGRMLRSGLVAVFATSALMKLVEPCAVAYALQPLEVPDHLLPRLGVLVSPAA